MDTVRIQPDVELSMSTISFGPVDWATFFAVRGAIVGGALPDDLCSGFLQRLARDAADREEFVRTVRLLVCSKAELGCDSAYFKAVLEAETTDGSGSVVALRGARRIGSIRGFDWLDDVCDRSTEGISSAPVAA